jgi:hypothetical protein
MNLLTVEERRVIESCSLDPSAVPAFEEIRYCLVWPDERTDEVMRMQGGYALLGDLWIVRGYIHRGVPVEDWGAFGGESFLETWNECVFGGLQWIGFRRIALTKQERAILDRALG